MQQNLLVLQLQSRSQKRYQNWIPSQLFFNNFPEIYGSYMHYFSVLRTPKPIFRKGLIAASRNKSIRLCTLKAKVYRCLGHSVHCTQVCMPILITSKCLANHWHNTIILDIYNHQSTITTLFLFSGLVIKISLLYHNFYKVIYVVYSLKRFLLVYMYGFARSLTSLLSLLSFKSLFIALCIK